MRLAVRSATCLTFPDLPSELGPLPLSPPDLATNQIALNFDKVPNDVHDQTDTFARAGIRHRGPHGVNIDAIRDSLTAALRALSYEAFPIHLTKEMLKAHQYQLQKFPVEDPSERKFLC
ncbi:hypothetical protein IVA87_12975 [Bradyrhizobium sp. 147]|uniref:hypothetical protein n=1 Tax=unclassified Bradyrhizobium TaxID=2631580 RepID=UPI001FF82B1D|nr:MULTISPECIES: hypothetical protein [unclassified Bradyrhizobium]MCK1547014.1 hypothetical protein [Bradyrhizobium sp. 179]MCK1597560.1 hypothetical protein [Bradyrhizobium sp. 164]MCK1627074.1 hypothetical protein [Bradyrhizobium sp. 160]MCK1680325.1 hypothetical protein [Bradyrhizobium sp. 147]